MSKKNKTKFRKRIKTQMLEEMAQIKRTPKPFAPPIQTAVRPNQNQGKISSSPAPTTSPAEIPNKSLNYIKKDLKKSAIIIASIIILIVALSIIDSKTNIILRSGDQIFRVLHIGG